MPDGAEIKEVLMSLSLKDRQVGDVTVVDAVGKITSSKDSENLREHFLNLAEFKARKILLNLGEVSRIDLGGTSTLLSVLPTVSRYGGTIKLLNLTRRIKDINHIMKISMSFEVHDDEAHAVRSF